MPGAGEPQEQRLLLEGDLEELPLLLPVPHGEEMRARAVGDHHGDQRRGGAHGDRLPR